MRKERVGAKDRRGLPWGFWVDQCSFGACREERAEEQDSLCSRFSILTIPLLVFWTRRKEFSSLERELRETAAD